MSEPEYLDWTDRWSALAWRALNPTGLLYVFQSWQRSPEVFSLLKRRFSMINEVIWDRRVPSMGGTTRRFSSVHDNIGVFARTSKYYFNLDAVRVPYDERTKKARSRSIFVGSKWLELGHNPKDVWSISRLHAIHRERQAHPTQKPRALVDRIVLSSCPPGGLVVDPFAGTGTTAESCQEHGRRCIAVEINEEYHSMIVARLLRASSRVGGPGEFEPNEPPAVAESVTPPQTAARAVDRVSPAAILGTLGGEPKTMTEIAAELGVSRVGVARQMMNLTVAGRVEPIGRGRGSKYRIKAVSASASRPSDPD
jgi:site-specific DNA-methyltransferase (adenine-specific)